MRSLTARRIGPLGLVLVAMATLAPGDAPAGHNGPLAAQWHLDQITPADTTPDSSGHGLTGATNEVEPTAGRFGTGLLLDSADASVRVPASTTLEPAAVTVVAWVRDPSPPGGDRTVLAKGGDGGCTASSWALDTGDGGGMEFYVRGPASNTRFDSPEALSGDVWDGSWHAVAGSYDGTTVRLYLDGQQVGTGAAGPAFIDYARSDRSFAMGQYPACSGLGFNGRLDEVQVYGRALSAAEIATLHNPAATTPPVIGATGGRPPSARPAVARFSVLGGLSPLRGVVLDGRRTTDASSLRWDLTGDGATDVVCPGSQPALKLTTTSAAARTVSLTAVGPGGSGPAASARVAGGGRTLGKRFARGIRDSAVCAADIGSLTGSDEPGCSPQTVMFGLVEASGCFRRVQGAGGIPSAERTTIRRYYDSPEYPATVVALCRRANTQRERELCETAKRQFDAIDFYVARGPVRINGITFTPSGGASVVVLPNLNRIISARASLRWGGMTVRGPRAVNFNPRSNIGTLGKRRRPGSSAPYGRFVVDEFDPGRGLTNIAGFGLDGKVTLSFVGINGERMSEGRLRLRLPGGFRALGGEAPSGEAAALASNRGGPTFSSLAISMPQALLGPVRVSDLSFRYERNGGIDGDRNAGTSCNRDEWKARLNVFLAGGSQGGLKLTPPPPQNGLGFCDGRFKHFGGDLQFGNTRPQIFPGVFLNSLGFNIQLSPTVLRGRGVLSAGDISEVDGELQMIFASPSAPYQQGPLRLTTTTIIGSGGLALNAPFFGRIPLGGGVLVYSYPDFVSFDGSARVVVPGMSIEGRLGGAARIGARLFSIQGGATACLGGVSGGACIGGDAWITSTGAVACLNIGPLHPGAGLEWRTRSLTIWPLDGCKPSRYWVTVGTARASQTSSSTFRVRSSERIKFVKLTGRGGAPRIRLTGPGGRSVVAADERFNTDASRTMQVVRSAAAGATFIGVKGRGTYRIETLPGSVPIGSVAASRPGYDTNFRARVTGRGATRTLVYDARRRGRQRVTFVEVGQTTFKPIVTVRGGRGRVRFKPALAPGRARRIVAIATVDGVSIPNQTLARFRAPAIPRTGRPRRVSVRRRGRTLSIRWSPVRAARRYGVVVELANGNERQIVVSRRRRSLRVRRISLTQGGVVRVSAQGARNEFGRPRAARFKRLRRPPSALVTRHENPRKR